MPVSLIASAAAPPAGGAPLGQVLGATAAGILLTLALMVIGTRYRAGRAQWLDAIAQPFCALLRVPAWSALPSALATGSLVLAGAGFYWDVSVHIDRGRDPGPFGTPAHYPILLGLFGLFAAGWLAMVMARDEDAQRTGVRLSPSWTVPTSGLVMMAIGGFALLGFPLDDIWHSIFGQDVTLWGPTHLIMLTGGQLMIPTILGLLREGRAAMPAARGRELTSGQRFGRWLIAVTGAGGVLAGLTIYQAEFGFGVPQYNLLFEPALLAFTGALALVLAAAIAGRGAALTAAVINIGISGAFAILVGPLLGQITPHFSTYLPAALAVEAAGLVIAPRKRLLRFAGLAAVLVGTVGTLGEFGWSHLWMPIPWPAHFVPSAIAIGVLAALAGALVGAFVGSTLGHERLGHQAGRRGWAPGAIGLAGFAAVIVFCLPTHPPAATATLALDHVTTGPNATAEATVTIRPASVVSEPDFVQQLSWQGHAKAVLAELRRVGPGVYRTTRPVPIAGTWKSMIRMQQGRVRGDVPVFLPADAAIPVPEVPALGHVTRRFESDTSFMQRERKKDIPGWLWSTATLAVMVMIAVLLVILGWGLHRVATLESGASAPPGARARRTPRGGQPRRAPATVAAGR